MSLTEKDISHYSTLGDIMICGDTNAQSGIETYCIDNSNTYIYVPHYPTCDGNIKYRTRKDVVCTPRRKELVDVCVASNMYILDGRTFGDVFW